MKKLSIFLFCLYTVVVSGCQPLPPIDPQTPQTVTTYQSIGPFKHVVVSGSMDVELEGRSPTRPNQITFIAPKEDAGTIVATVKNGTLYLRSMEMVNLNKAAIRTRVKIPTTGMLNSIIYDGSGVLTGKNLRTHQFKLTVYSSRYVNLSGPQLDLRALEARGNGEIIVSSISTEHLNLKSNGSTRIVLSGTAKSTDLTLAQNSVLNARELLTQKSYTNTADNARAEVRVVKLLNAFSSGYSNIYYYAQEPALLNKYLRQRGSVLYFPQTVS
ncbi:MAG: GIN domain-containing protein [Gammaproteobacteria bacterium]